MPLPTSVPSLPLHAYRFLFSVSVLHHSVGACTPSQALRRPLVSPFHLREALDLLQQDITRGRNMVDSLYQGFGVGAGGTHNAILSSEEYRSQAQRTLNNIEDGFYISPPFLDKISIHVAKNFLDLPKIKVPLILGALQHFLHTMSGHQPSVKCV